MGSEVTQRFFEAADFSSFRDRLDEETDLLNQVISAHAVSPRGNVAGFELEAWLVDNAGTALPDNEAYLAAVDSNLVVPELAKFNIEINGSPCALTGRVFTRLHDELSATWARCQAVAAARNYQVIAIGTLPTARTDLFVDANMSGEVRYQCLNDRVLALRDGRKIEIDIDGEDSLSLKQQDVMLEAAATSFQMHLQCKPEQAVRDFNASLMVSAPLVAVSANAPYLFGRSLWDDSRIPLFEQSVDCGARHPPRVTFGTGYARSSLMEWFEENRRDHQILIPMLHDAAPGRFAHLRFQNGTVWRWVRPLLGFDFDGQVHLRIEQRVPSAGPTLKDCIANAAFYYGVVRGLGLLDESPEQGLDFDDARENFYKAARYGLNAHVCWLSEGRQEELPIRKLIINELLPLARRGLESLDIPADEIHDYLDIIGARTDDGQNGALWQRRWMKRNEGNFRDLVHAYAEHQATDRPVHTWAL
jgi:gamma-glutamyl:cysteine ligase YbdK (ATP-grasp superfamily)